MLSINAIPQSQCPVDRSRNYPGSVGRIRTGIESSRVPGKRRKHLPSRCVPQLQLLFTPRTRYQSLTIRREGARGDPEAVPLEPCHLALRINVPYSEGPVI